MVIRLSQSDRVNEWDEEAVAELFAGLNESSKSVLSAIARASLGEEGSIKEEVLARSLEHSMREVREIAKEINLSANDNAYASLVSLTISAEVLPNGRTVDDRRFSMADHIAEWVRNAEREEARSIGHPLLGGNA